MITKEQGEHIANLVRELIEFEIAKALAGFGPLRNPEGAAQMEADLAVARMRLAVFVTSLTKEPK